MNFDELKNLVSMGESDRLEFKRSTGQRTQAAKTACAMLNGIGGFILFGINDNGDFVGQQVTAKTLEDVSAEMRRIEPQTFPVVETLDIGKEKSVIVLHVAGGGGLYTFEGRPYMRQGPTTRIMPHGEYNKRLMDRLHSTRRWENEPVANGVSVEDLDEDEILITLDNAIRLGRLEATDRRSLPSILQGLELIRDGNLLNAAVALYGKSGRLRTLYPQMSIRLARFRGQTRLADFSDNRQYWGHAFSLLRRAESFLMDHVPIAGRVLPGRTVREDQPWYPPRATREALANALCHRDYTIPGGAVSVAMYDDHLEITNPGSFQFGITPEKLTQPHESRPWNPIIANVFYRAGIIERWGSGTLNIIDWLKANNNPTPSWEEQAGSIYVTFRPAALPEDHREPRENILQEVMKLGTKSAPSRHQLQIMNKCREDRTLLQLMEIAGRSDRTKFKHQVLNPLIEAGFIEMTIPDKPQSSKQKYRLSDKGVEFLSGGQKIRR